MSDESDAATASFTKQVESDTTNSRSQVQSPEAGYGPVPKFWPKWRGKPVFDGNKDAMGWTLVSISSLINYVGTGAFLATTILRLAEFVDKCHASRAGMDVDLDELCGPRIKFMKPSSLLTFYAMVVGFIAACIIPIIGAIIDHTRYRLRFARISAGLLTALLFPLMFLNKNNYIIILVCHGCSVFIGWFVTSFHFAYLPELSTNELQLNHWTKSITMWSYFGMMIYLGGVVILRRSLGDSKTEIFTSNLGMGIAFGINLVFLQLSWWFLFGEREALHILPENSSLCSIGFKQLYDTGRHIRRNYRSLKWYLLHINMANAGWQAFGIIALTYMSDFLNMTPLNSAIAIIISFVGAFPGAIFGSFLARRLDPIKAGKINTVLMIVCITVFVLVLTAPGQSKRTYVYFLFIGFNNGMKVNLDRLLSASLIPIGQEAEMMGVWLFADQCLLWLPLLVYTLMNEANIHPRVSIAVLNAYLCLSLFYLCMTGTYADARAEVNRTSVFSSKGLEGLKKATEETAAALEGTKDIIAENNENSQPRAKAEESIAEA